MAETCAVHQFAQAAIGDHEGRIRLLEKEREEDRAEYKILIARITDLVTIIKWFIATTITVCGIVVTAIGIWVGP